ncbi:MAG: YegS/Rv2252/BmrU family lipid kinase [Oscillospiraceae bacterium]|nr:YegS/Rv2252/BmrU family lipid kinase [Oscillospiraceae bacterium]
MQTMLLLVNPNAGKGGYKSELGGVLRTFSDGGWLPSVCFSHGPGEIPFLVERYAADYDMVACIGGDGTLSEVCSGMMRAAERRPIGYIPLGTANDVAHTLGLAPKPVDAAKQLISGAPIPYDIGRFGENDYFTYVAAFGAFTEVSFATPQESKQALGHMAYMLEALRRLPTLTDCHAVVEYDGGSLEGNFIFGAVTNSTSVGGLVKLDEDMVGLADGTFEVLLVRTPRDLLDLGDIISAVRLLDFSGPNVSFIRSRSVHFRFDRPVTWTRDGEDGGAHQEAVIHNCHPGVEIIV